jgi:hypothetical protein
MEILQYYYVFFSSSECDGIFLLGPDVFCIFRGWPHGMNQMLTCGRTDNVVKQLAHFWVVGIDDTKKNSSTHFPNVQDSKLVGFWGRPNQCMHDWAVELSCMGLIQIGRNKTKPVAMEHLWCFLSNMMKYYIITWQLDFALLL